MAEILINGKTQKYGLIGNPVSHSFSPDMQTKALQAISLNAVYLPFLVTERDLAKVPNAFELLGVQGFNVTVPFKEKIIPFLDQIDPDAKLLGSVNTVVKTESGWKGYSTDGNGFIRSLHACGVSVKGKQVLIIGAGGAAKAVALSVLEQIPALIHLQNRTPQKALGLAEMLMSKSRSIQIKTNPELKPAYDILINTTSVGMESHLCPVSEEIVANAGYVADIIYNPSQTRLLELAQKYEIPHQNGIGMLLYQGVEAFEIWTGQKAPLAIMQESLNKSLAFM